MRGRSTSWCRTHDQGHQRGVLCGLLLHLLPEVDGHHRGILLPPQLGMVPVSDADARARAQHPDLRVPVKGSPSRRNVADDGPRARGCPTTQSESCQRNASAPEPSPADTGPASEECVPFAAGEKKKKRTVREHCASRRTAAGHILVLIAVARGPGRSRGVPRAATVVGKEAPWQTPGRGLRSGIVWAGSVRQLRRRDGAGLSCTVIYMRKTGSRRPARGRTPAKDCPSKKRRGLALVPQ
uniref:Uncharacterized protein n=1 Tax=Ixodes scapularis TaxID=6945 RepID=A0A4D5RD34_IXOSC